MTSTASKQRWSISSIPDQAGRIAIVTGANSGIGYVTARELAKRNAHVVLACRDRERGAAALSRMRAEVPHGRIEVRVLDLACQRSIQRFCEQLECDHLDLLVNNAGVALSPLARTVDGFESQLGINHLGTFALTARLSPRLLAARAPRVVTVSSEGQRFAYFDMDNLNAERGFNSFFAYLQSKRANLYFALHLQRLADAAGAKLRSMVVAPGLTRTNVLTGGANAGRGWLYQALVRVLLRFAFRPTPEGAKTSLFAATMEDLPGGSYVVPDGVFQLYGEPTLRVHDRALRHTAAAAELWQRSEQLTGVRFALDRSERTEEVRRSRCAP